MPVPKQAETLCSLSTTDVRVRHFFCPLSITYDISTFRINRWRAGLVCVSRPAPLQERLGRVYDWTLARVEPQPIGCVLPA